MESEGSTVPPTILGRLKRKDPQEKSPHFAFETGSRAWARSRRLGEDLHSKGRSLAPISSSVIETTPK